MGGCGENYMHQNLGPEGLRGWVHAPHTPCAHPRPQFRVSDVRRWARRQLGTHFYASYSTMEVHPLAHRAGGTVAYSSWISLGHCWYTDFWVPDNPPSSHLMLACLYRPCACCMPMHAPCMHTRCMWWCMRAHTALSVPTPERKWARQWPKRPEVPSCQRRWGMRMPVGRPPGCPCPQPPREGCI